MRRLVPHVRANRSSDTKEQILHGAECFPLVIKVLPRRVEHRTEQWRLRFMSWRTLRNQFARLPVSTFAFLRLFLCVAKTHRPITHRLQTAPTSVNT